MASRAAAKGASAASSNGCVCVACFVVHVLFDFLCVWPDECPKTSFSAAAVSRLVPTLPSSGCLPVYWRLACRPIFPLPLRSPKLHVCEAFKSSSFNFRSPTPLFMYSPQLSLYPS
jgi:hypothetical protein